MVTFRQMSIIVIGTCEIIFSDIRQRGELTSGIEGKGNRKVEMNVGIKVSL